MSETARAASRRRVHGVARWARDLPWSSRAHLLVVVVTTFPSIPVKLRDVQGSQGLKVAVFCHGVVLHGATLLRVAAQVQAVFLGVSSSVEHVGELDATARVFEEGFF